MERWTIDWLETATNGELIAACIRERRGHCTNVNTPLYQRLTKLLKWVEETPELSIQTGTSASAPELLDALKRMISAEDVMRGYAYDDPKTSSLALVKCAEANQAAQKVVAKAEGRGQ